MLSYSKVIFTIFLVISIRALEPDHDKESYIFTKFQTFLKEHKKNYATIEEYIARFKIFKSNYEKLEALNTSGMEKPYKIGITKFFDMTPQEFRRIYLNLKISILDLIKAKGAVYQISLEYARAEFDWRKHGAVGPVKDQGSCGSCWAFSSVANLEGIFYIKNKSEIILSEQQLVDCDKVDSGCNGGLMENAFKYVAEHGLALASDYRYTGKSGSCKQDHTKAAIYVKGHHFAPDHDEENIKKMLVETGPLAIAINADKLQFYEGGIIDDDANDCDPQGLNHGVAIVGYGTENGQDYWIIRNSWGTNWGEKGYVRFALGKGVCGVNSYVITAKLD